MKVSKMTVMVGALTLALSAGPAFAQTPPPAQNPPAQNPPAQPPTQPPTQPPAQPPTGTQPPAAPTPQTPAQPPKPFPEGAKVALLNMQAIASTSVEGKAATGKIQELVKKKTAELTEKQKQGQAIQTKLQQGGTVLSDQARSQAEKDLQRIQRELQAMQEDAQQEQTELTQQLQMEFQEQLNPIIEQVATEKGLHVVLSVDQNSNVVWGYSGIDITAEVIKRFDAASKTAPKK
jgi:Skp family chaperone for outer membrane proteins